MSTSWRKSAVAEIAKSRKNNSTVNATLHKTKSGSTEVDKCVDKCNNHNQQNKKPVALYIG